MDTSSPFAISSSPAALESVSLSQLLAHIRASDQTEAFVQEVVYNTPAPSVASSFVRRSSKRSGIIVNKKRNGIIVNKKSSGFSSDSDSDNETAITCSSIGSVNRRTVGGAAARKRSLRSAWFDEDDVGDEESSDDEDDVSTIAQRAAGRGGLTPSKRSLENLKNMSMFDAGFSFSRTCVTSPVQEISPLESWF
jgi:hypothetical protein